MVETQEPTRSLAAFDRTGGSKRSRHPSNQSISNSLVISLVVVVLDVFSYSPTNVTLSNRDDLTQAFRFDGTNEPLGVRIRIWTSSRRLDRSDA